MSVERIDALMMKKCFLAGAKALESRKDYINELNVFPVPDGDTGTNMTMTIMAAVREINKLQDVTVDSLCRQCPAAPCVVRGVTPALSCPRSSVASRRS